jgi:hypothetical protein
LISTVQVYVPAVTFETVTEPSPVALGVVSGAAPVQVMVEIVPPAICESTDIVKFVSGRLWNATDA